MTLLLLLPLKVNGRAHGQKCRLKLRNIWHLTKAKSVLSKVGPRLSKRTKYNKDGKQRQQRDVYVLDRIDKDTNCEKKYYIKDWKEQEASNVLDSFSITDSNTASIEGFTVYDNYNGRAHDSDRHLIAFDKENGDFLFGKVAPRQATSYTGTKKNWNKVRKLLVKVLKLKPDVGRGDGRSGYNDAYKIYGYRKDPKGKTVKKYSFKGKDKEENTKNEEEVGELADRMEAASERISIGLKETEIYDNLKKKIKLPTFRKGRRATAFSIGRNYMSKSHKDLDYYLTTLSALTGSSDCHDAILYYFVFPAYKAVIPIRSGEIIIFNPLAVHSCTNPRYEDSWIFSAYVSAKTVLTQAAAELSNDGNSD